MYFGGTQKFAMKYTTLAIAIFCSLVTFGQGKEKGKSKDKKPSTTTPVTKITHTSHDNIIWEGTRDNDGGRPKPSKNQPAKVRAAFKRDYPYVTNVRWSKYRGDWTATFTNGPFISTAVYHANGDRRDTRTSLLRSQLPPIILENIFKKAPGADIGVGVKIEIPKAFKDVFRIRAVVDGVSRFMYYDKDGEEVTYDY